MDGYGGSAATAYFGILGPLRVWAGGGEHAISRRNVARLLGALLLTPGRLVNRGLLVDQVWGPSGCDQRTLHTTIFRLRGWLEEQVGLAGVVTRVGHDYRLEVPPENIDVGRFRDLARQSREERDPDLRVELLRSALAVWRGPTLDGLLEPGASAVAGELEKARVDCACRLAEAAVERGRPDAALDPLERLADELPFDEIVHAHVITLLARCGRRAEARRRFATLRRRLADELGVEPSPPLVEAYLGLLDAPAPTAAPKEPRPCLLPPDLPDFTGRERDLALVVDALAGEAVGSAGMVAISGMPGVGKTALAVHAAHRLTERFPDGQLFVDLHAHGPHPAHPAQILARFLRALGIHATAIPEGVDERTEVFRALLSERRVLVVLDNAAGLDQIRPLLPGQATSAVLVTTRARLAEPYGMRHVALDVLERSEAIELLARIIGDGRAAGEPRAVAGLADLCGRLPLALRIAGARTAMRPHQPVASLVRRLADAANPLDHLAVGALDVRAGLELSYAGLAPAMRRLFRLLGLLDMGDFAGWAVTALLDRSPAETEELAECLVDAHLLTAVRAAETGEIRYRFHDLVRAFASECAYRDEPEPERRQALRRVFDRLGELIERVHEADWGSDFFLARGHRRSPVAGPAADGGSSVPLRWFHAERANIVTAVRQAANLGMHRTCWTLAIGATFLYESTHAYDEWRQTHQVALSAAVAGGDDLGVAAVNGSLALMYADMHQWGQAEMALEASVPLLESRDEETLGRVLVLAGWIDYKRGRFREALFHYQRAVAILQRSGSRGALAMALRCAAQLHLDLGELDLAEQAVERALALGEAGGHYSRLRALAIFGELRVAGDRLADARSVFGEVLDAAHQTGSPRLQVHALYGLGIVCSRTGAYDNAESYLGAALTQARQDLQQDYQVRILLALADSRQGQRRYDEAADCLHRAVAVSRRMRAPHWEARVIRALRDLRAGSRGGR
ncbi:BTAD domain-containing putative transcriptional regulator [Microbispora catharanthi]|uniref:Tetratricopeptide repeat protein n=1 Tax=Microbispora catharanthi TaxID=1712871 RepID=A0A5N6C4J8_9ACTN|nr:BTAD domain-containing putative transcriptional regulator [Microbispora catharanthi]KAB8187687.1 tetratricopeptide repeat protein [Microbispora catharanthi]